MEMETTCKAKEANSLIVVALIVVALIVVALTWLGRRHGTRE